MIAISIKEYATKLENRYDYDPRSDSNLKARYAKACFVYKCMKDPHARLHNWSDRNFGRLTQPTDAFEVMWDV